MKKFIMTEKEYTPYVSLDAEKGVLEISGRSFPENANRFYKPIMKWIEDYMLDPKPVTELNLKFTYLNTASSKKMLELIKKIAGINNLGKKININWYYEEGEEDMLGAGTEFSSVLEIPFNYIEIK